MRRAPFLVLSAVAAFAHGGVANAVVLQPDGREPRYDDWNDYMHDLELGTVDPGGEVLASRTTPFEVGVYSEQADRDVWVKGTLQHQVVREPHSGYLSFHYRFGMDSSSGDTTDFEGATIYDFGHYFTDVRTDDYGTRPTIVRGDAPGFGDYVWYRNEETFDHTILVRTDAPDFAEGGRFLLDADFDGWGVEGVADVATFRPVPEPAAAGAMTLTGAALLLRRRRHPASAPRPGATR
jgi:hypothetical protein